MHYTEALAHKKALLDKARTPHKAPAGIRHKIVLIVGLVYLQILLGGMVAGLDAGLLYPQWPLMGDGFFPTELFADTPFYLNFMDNGVQLQFTHRLVAYLITFLTFILWLRLLRSKSIELKKSSKILLYITLAQSALGIITLLHHVPIALASLHQAGAILVFSAALYAHKHSRV